MTEGPVATRLPYFNAILKRLADNDTAVHQAFGSHIHWGFWENPSTADGSVADFAEAAEQMTRLVTDAARIQDGDRVLDAGCGFGGTVASLNQRFSSVGLVGLNVDDRQIARARQMVVPKAGNAVEFVEGDACVMPFAAASFDVVLAVECIFHFPSRLRFFQEAHRVLRSGGRLALCDFLPRTLFKEAARGPLPTMLNRVVARAYGPCEGMSLKAYRALAKQVGFENLQEDDITRNTLPTYAVVKQLLPRGFARAGEALWATRVLEWESRLGLLRYMVLSWQK